MSGSLYGISKISEITPHLLLTSIYGATRENIIKNGCTLLVNCAQELPKQDITGVESIKLFLDDMPYAIINVYFDRIADRIAEHANRGGRTIIHCVCGISRAASISIAYLMKYKHMSLREAYDYVKTRRSVIRPNQGFWRQLIEYEKRLNNKAGAQNSNHQTQSQNKPTMQVSRDNYSTQKPNYQYQQNTGTPIPIQIVSSSSSSSVPHYSSQVRSNSLRGRPTSTYTASDYTIPSDHIEKSTRYNTSNTYTRNTTVMPHSNSHRAMSASNLFNDAQHTIPIPPVSEFVTYESSTSKRYNYPNGNHRQSLHIDHYNDPKYSTHRPSRYSTIFKSGYDF